MAVPQTANNIIALDVGGARIGVALANYVARFANPLTTVQNDGQIWDSLAKIIKDEQVGKVVVGLPRNLSGDDTQQTTVARKFADEVSARFGVDVYLQDEALTSKKAEAELDKRGGKYQRGDVDALAATYILEDYLLENQSA